MTGGFILVALAGFAILVAMIAFLWYWPQTSDFDEREHRDVTK